MSGTTALRHFEEDISDICGVYVLEQNICRFISAEDEFEGQ
jgi:hypothetical protein